MALALVLAALDLDAQGGQTPQALPAEPPCGVVSRSPANNGIGVGDPRIFDSRTLTLMLENLNESLRNVQFVDAKTLAASLNLLQGSQQDSITRSVSLQSAPLPGITDTAKTTEQAGTTTSDTVNRSRTDGVTTTTSPANTTTTGTRTRGSGNTTGSTASSGQENTTQTTTAARAPAAPDLPAVLTSPAFTPQFGQNGADLLNDQVNLTYQIFNVRLLLERALTDRLIGTEPRLQAIVGFNVTINPPRDTQDSAAFMEVSVTTGASEPVSVVAMMPQEKTYNSAALSNRSTAFGGSAVAQMFSVGYTERRQSQLFYLFRDNDTVSFEGMDGTPAEKRFGWVFRPVLGRRAVAGNPRQMFAVIALPHADSGVNTAIPLQVRVRTYWQRYDRGTLTTANARTFWQGVGRAVSLWSAQGRPPSTESSFTTCVRVPTTENIQHNMRPRIDALQWQRTDDKTAVVTVQGRNFFENTAVRLGSSRYVTTADGLTFKSDRGFDLTVPLAALLGKGMIDGRYGSAIDMLQPNLPDHGIRIQSVTVNPPAGGRRALEIVLSARNGTALAIANLPGAPLVSLSGAVVPSPYRLEEEGARVRLLVHPPVDLFPNGEGLVTVTFPFAGEAWTYAHQVYDPNLAFTVTRFASQAAAPTRLLVLSTDAVGNPFTAACPAGSALPQWTMLLGTSYPVTAASSNAAGASLISPQFLEIRAPNQDLADHPLLLKDCLGTVYRLPVPAAPAAKPDPVTLAKTEPEFVNQHDARKVTIEGTNLDRVAAVNANGYTLDSRVTDGGKKLEVFLLRALTEHPGVLTLVCRDDKGTILGSVDVTIR